MAINCEGGSRGPCCRVAETTGQAAVPGGITASEKARQLTGDAGRDAGGSSRSQRGREGSGQEDLLGRHLER